MNLFDLSDVLASEELCETLAEGKEVRIERIVSTGQITPEDKPYDQEEDEWVCLLSGQAQITFYEDGGQEQCIELSQGDTLLIGAHRRHRVTYTSAEPPCVWLCVFAGQLHSPQGENQ